MYQMQRHYVTFTEGSALFRGLKSTVTTSSEPTALLGPRNISFLKQNYAFSRNGRDRMRLKETGVMPKYEAM